MQCVPLFLQVDFATYIFGHTGSFDTIIVQVSHFRHSFELLSNLSFLCNNQRSVINNPFTSVCSHMDSPMDKSHVRLLDSLIDGHSNFEITIYHHLVLPASNNL